MLIEQYYVIGMVLLLYSCERKREEKKKTEKHTRVDFEVGEKMYRKDSESWLKHVDFILLDMICLQVAFVLAYAARG